MAVFYYYSRNGKKDPFKVTVRTDGDVFFIDCDCPLGLDRKICRHKINAIRGDRSKASKTTTDSTLTFLRRALHEKTSLRQRLENGWLAIRHHTHQKPDDKDGEHRLRRELGELFASGFKNELAYTARKQEALSILDFLGTGEVVSVFYEGGSRRAGIQIGIVPLDVDGGNLVAHCCDTGATEVLSLDRVRLSADQPPS